MNITLREWTLDDADRLVDVVENSDMKYMRSIDGDGYARKDALDYIRWILGLGKHKKNGPAHGVFRAIVLDGEIVGSISIECGGDIRAIDGQLGYYIMSEYAGRGIATRAVECIASEAFEMLEILRISAYVATENVASLRVLEKNGFIREGTLHKGAYMHGEIVDVAIMARLRD